MADIENETDVNNESVAEASRAGDVAIRLPSLSIIHLMIWMTCSAVFFWQSQLTFEAQGGIIEELENTFLISYSTIQRLIGAISSVVSGAALTAAIALGQRKYQSRGPYAFHPGHWLLLGHLAAQLIQFAAGLLNAFYPEFQLARANTVNFFWVLASCVPMVPYAIGAFQSRGVAWRTLLSLLALGNFFQTAMFLVLVMGNDYGGLLQILNSLANYLSLGVAFGMVVFATIERARGERRDWAHWTGVGTQTVNLAMIVFWMVMTAFAA